MEFIITEVDITLLHSPIHIHALLLQAFMPEIDLLKSQPLLYVKPTLQEQPGQGHSVPSLQSNTDFPLKGQFCFIRFNSMVL